MDERTYLWGLIIICGWLSFFSCGNRVDTSKAIKFEMDKGDPLKNGDGLRLADFRIVNLEKTAASSLSTIVQVECLDSMFLVLDLDLLRAFKTDGEFVRAYGSVGEKDGQYTSPDCFFVIKGENSVAVLDAQQRKINKYSIADGSLVETFRYENSLLPALPGYAVSLTDSIVVFSEQLSDGRKTVLSTFNCYTKEYKSLTEAPMKATEAAACLGRYTMRKCNDRVLAIKPYDKGIYQVNPDGKLELEYLVEDNRKSVQNSRLTKIKNFNVAYCLRFEEDGYFIGFSGVFETANTIMLPYHELRYYLIDKRTNDIRLYLFAVDDNYYSLPLVNIVSSCTHCLIGVANYYRMMPYKSKKAEVKDNNMRKFVNFVNNIVSDDNPSLLIYDII